MAIGEGKRRDDISALKVPVFGVILVRIWTEYGDILRISPYSVRMRINTDQNNSEYGHFLRSEKLPKVRSECEFNSYHDSSVC